MVGATIRVRVRVRVSIYICLFPTHCDILRMYITYCDILYFKIALIVTSQTVPAVCGHSKQMQNVIKPHQSQREGISLCMELEQHKILATSPTLSKVEVIAHFLSVAIFRFNCI